MIKLIKTITLTAGLLAAISLSTNAIAAGDGPHIEEQSWSFSGPFGHYDKAQLQRGFQIYRESCASCHSLDLLSFRNLMQAGGPGFTEAQAKVIASEYEVMDGPDEAGDMFERPGILSDHFPGPFPNVEAAKASNNGAAPPDFSLLAKARAVERGFPTFIFDIFTQYQESGPDYIYGLLTGYTDAPAGTEVSDGTYYNPHYIGGNALAMSPPLFDEQIEYTDGSPQTVDQYARDVSAFMMWAAEPKLEERKRMGFIVMAFLLLLSGLLYLTKRKVWANIEH